MSTSDPGQDFAARAAVILSRKKGERDSSGVEDNTMPGGDEDEDEGETEGADADISASEGQLDSDGIFAGIDGGDDEEKSEPVAAVSRLS